MGSCFGGDILGDESLEYTSSTITGLTLTDPSARSCKAYTYRISIVKVAGITEVK